MTTENQNEQQPINGDDIFSDRNTLGPELEPAGTYENMIALGCLCALFVFAAFGVFCTIYLLIKGRP